MAWCAYAGGCMSIRATKTGLDIKHLVYMPMGQVVLKIYVPCKNFDVPSQYLYKPCKAYVYCWKNKYMPRLKNHLPSRARNHQSLFALGQDLHASGTRAHLNVEPCKITGNSTYSLRLTTELHIDGLVQDCSNSIALATELLQSCTKPSTLLSHCERNLLLPDGSPHRRPEKGKLFLFHTIITVKSLI